MKHTLADSLLQRCLSTAYITFIYAICICILTTLSLWSEKEKVVKADGEPPSVMESEQKKK